MALGIFGSCTTSSGGENPGTTSDSSDDAELTEASVPGRSAIELGDLEPEAVLVGDGLVFGEVEPLAETTVAAYLEDPLVVAAVARSVFSEPTSARLGTVTVLAIAPGVFTDEVALEGYVSGLADDPDSTSPSRQLDLGERRGFAAATDASAVVAFREQNLVVLVEAPTAGDAGGLATKMVAAIDAGEVGSAPARTPLSEIEKSTAFIDVPGFEFEPFLASDEESGFESLDAPLVDGLEDLPEGRLVVVGNEIRGAAWSIPVSVDAYESADEVVEPMRSLVESRSGVEPDEVDEQLIAGVTIYVGDGDEAIRVFRHANLILVVDGLDSAEADSFAAAWARALNDD